MAKTIVLKSRSMGDIVHAHRLGIWQHGSGSIGHKTPHGSYVVIKLTGDDRAYILGVTDAFPGPADPTSPEIDWPSKYDQNDNADYKYEFTFTPFSELKEISWQELREKVPENIDGWGGVVELATETLFDLRKN
jgi:hypothetical protein